VALTHKVKENKKMNRDIYATNLGKRKHKREIIKNQKHKKRKQKKQ
jgi:hypothetical protein